MQCQADAAPTPHKICQISQVSHVKDNNAPFSQIVIGKPVNGKPTIVTAHVPVKVAARAPLTLKVDDADPGVTAPLDRCVPAGCFADFEIKDDYLKKLRAAEGVGSSPSRMQAVMTSACPFPSRVSGPRSKLCRKTDAPQRWKTSDGLIEARFRQMRQRHRFMLTKFFVVI